MLPLRKLFSRCRTWFAVCAATVACNSIFDIQDPIEQPAGGAACILNSSCPSGQVCLFRLCSPPCETDVDCSVAGSRCLHTDAGTACVSDTQASCETADCPSGTICEDGACYAECTGASPCADGHTCVDGACKGVPASSAGGAGAGGASGGSGAEPTGGNAGSPPADDGAGGQGGEGGQHDDGPLSVCTPDERTCEDNAVKTCNADGTAYLTPAKDCSESQTCVLGTCENHECKPGADFCSGKTVRTCADNGLSSTETKICSASQYCDAASAKCQDGICAPNQPACNGNTATSCNASGSGYAAGGTVCGANETCEGGACLEHVCTPSATYCQGQDVKKCAANGLSSSVSSTCNASKTCVAAGANASCAGVCGPGQTNCAGNGVQPCNANGQWGKAVPCKTNQTCDAGLCTACPSNKLNCDDDSDNACETNLASTSTCGSTCANVVACSAQHGTPSCGGGSCGISCSASYGDCSGTNDGCETNVTTDANNCGVCGKLCSSNHMATRTCGGAVCNGDCAGGYGDCDANKQTNGCETNTNTDPNHCGACPTVCKYRSCVGGSCNASTFGDAGLPGQTTIKLLKNTLWAFKLSITPPGGESTTLLQALGIAMVVDGIDLSAHLRIGLYADGGAGAPKGLEAQTTPLTSVNGLNEQILSSAVSVATGAHWLAVVADRDIRVHADTNTTNWASASLTYANITSLPATFPLPSSTTLERGHLFAITTP